MNNHRAAVAFSALGHPFRVDLLRTVVRSGRDGRNVGDLRDHFAPMPATTFGHHLKALADAGLIIQTKSGRALFSTANFEMIEGVIGFLMIECCAEQEPHTPDIDNCTPS